MKKLILVCCFMLLATFVQAQQVQQDSLARQEYDKWKGELTNNAANLPHFYLQTTSQRLDGSSALVKLAIASPSVSQKILIKPLKIERSSNNEPNFVEIGKSSTISSQSTKSNDIANFSEVSIVVAADSQADALEIIVFSDNDQNKRSLVIDLKDSISTATITSLSR